MFKRINEVLKQYVPGHFMAYTFWLMLAVSFGTYNATGKVTSTIWMALAVIISFPGDQATHLNQPNHADPAPTAIERWFQEKDMRSIWITFSLGLVIMFIYAAFSS